jgi:A/G-specific adenine glycosylase
MPVGPSLHNQAMMELGALVCRPRRPLCGECPLADACRARRAGDPGALPELPEKPAPIEVRLVVGLAERGSGTLLARAPAGGFLAGTWAPPFARLLEGEAPAAAFRAAARRDHGLALALLDRIGTVRHTITNHRIRAEVHRARLDSPAAGDGIAFVPPDRYREFGLSSLARKSLRLQA